MFQIFDLNLNEKVDGMINCDLSTQKTNFKMKVFIHEETQK